MLQSNCLARNVTALEQIASWGNITKLEGNVTYMLVWDYNCDLGASCNEFSKYCQQRKS